MTSNRRNQFPSSSSPPLPPDNGKNPYSHSLSSMELSSSSSQFVNEENSPSTLVENINDRLIYETGSTTVHSVLRTQPAFIGKLYKMVEDDTHNLICWSNNGEYFSVHNSGLFSKQILPQYFKHNNWQSFVRQLNMYGFSKINDMIHSNISYEDQIWEFKHPHFKRGDFHSLGLVKRKSVRSAPGPVSGHLNIPGPSISPHYQSQTSDNSGTGLDSATTTTNTTTLDEPSASQPDFQYIMDEEGGVENRVLRLDQQVQQVSQSVTHLTSEMHDIKTLIYNQQALIHDLADLLRSCHDISAPSVDTSIPPQRITSLPSIHNLANNLRHAANIDTSEQQPPHRLSYPYTTCCSEPSPTSSSKSLSSPADNHHSHYHPPPSSADDSHPQRRRSSHPSSNNPLYSLLNSTPDHNIPYTHH